MGEKLKRETPIRVAKGLVKERRRMLVERRNGINWVFVQSGLSADSSLLAAR